jgi:hypothetical protein
MKAVQKNITMLPIYKSEAFSPKSGYMYEDSFFVGLKACQLPSLTANKRWFILFI